VAANARADTITAKVQVVGGHRTTRGSATAVPVATRAGEAAATDVTVAGGGIV